MASLDITSIVPPPSSAPAPAPPPSSDPVTPSSTPPPPPTSNTPAPPSTAPAPPPSSAQGSTATDGPTTTRNTPSTTSSAASPSVVVVTEQSVVTISGVVTSTPVVIQSTASGASANADNSGGGLSSGAKTGIIAGCATVGGLIVLGLLAFFLLRWNRRRKANYVPGEDEIRWPVAEAEADTLFPAAVRQTGGAGFVDREPSMRSTVAGTSYGGSSAQQHYGQQAYPGAPAFAYTNYEAPPSTYNDHAPPANYQQHADYSEYSQSPTERQVGITGLSSQGHDMYNDDGYSQAGGANLDRGFSVASRPHGNLGVVNRDAY